MILPPTVILRAVTPVVSTFDSSPSKVSLISEIPSLSVSRIQSCVKLS